MLLLKIVADVADGAVDGSQSYHETGYPSGVQRERYPHIHDLQGRLRDTAPGARRAGDVGELILYKEAGAALRCCFASFSAAEIELFCRYRGFV